MGHLYATEHVSMICEVHGQEHRGCCRRGVAGPSDVSLARASDARLALVVVETAHMDRDHRMTMSEVSV